MSFPNRSGTRDLPHTGRSLYHWATGDSRELRPYNQVQMWQTSRIQLGLVFWFFYKFSTLISVQTSHERTRNTLCTLCAWQVSAPSIFSSSCCPVRSVSASWSRKIVLERTNFVGTGLDSATVTAVKECRKTKTKTITMANHNKRNNTMNQSELKADTRNRR